MTSKTIISKANNDISLLWSSLVCVRIRYKYDRSSAANLLAA